MARVLLVEDEQVNRVLAAAQLRRGGHLVREVETGESAKAIVGSLGCPDVIVLDVHLPGIDGLSVLRYLREELCPRPIGAVIVSAGAGPGPDHRDHVLVDRDVYLVKPVIGSELLDAVDDVTPGPGERRRRRSRTNLHQALVPSTAAWPST